MKEYIKCKECNTEILAVVEKIEISLRCPTTAIEIVADNICVACANKSLIEADDKMVKDMLKKLGFIK